MHLIARIAFASVAAVVTFSAHAQPARPTRPVTLVVPFPPGGGTDLVVRSLQPALSRALGQTVIITNLGGAGGTIGSAQAARAQPDGYTALAVTTSTHAVSPSLYKTLPYDPLRDFSYVGFIGTSPYVLVTHPALKAKTMGELTQALKTRSNSSFASVGVGTVSHLLGEIFQRDIGAELTHVPYRGAAPAYTDLIGEQVDMMFDNPVGLAPFVRSGKLLAVGTTAATPILPEVRTFAEQGLPGYTQQLWYGLAFPKGTPVEIVTRLNTVLNDALKDPAVAADLASKGVDVRPDTAEALSRAVEHDTPYWNNVVQSVGVNLD